MMKITIWEHYIKTNVQKAISCLFYPTFMNTEERIHSDWLRFHIKQCELEYISQVMSVWEINVISNRTERTNIKFKRKMLCHLFPFIQSYFFFNGKEILITSYNNKELHLLGGFINTRTLILRVRAWEAIHNHNQHIQNCL